MTPNRTYLPLAAGVLVLLIGSAAPAQTPYYDGGLDLSTGEAFAPADLSQYDDRPEPAQGYFFVWEGLHWNISTPKPAPIGLKNGVRTVFTSSRVNAAPPFQLLDWYDERNTHNNGVIEARYANGQRVEFGRIYEHNGWLFDVHYLHAQDQRVNLGSMQMVFDDPEILLIGDVGPSPNIPGAELIEPLPIKFTTGQLENRIKLFSTELNYVYRMHRSHHGGIFELFLGARYLELDERFSVLAGGGVLADSYWLTEAQNHIIGPQVGVHWFREYKRWTLTTEGRFFAGFNRQNYYQEGRLASQAVVGTFFNPMTGSWSDFVNTAFENEWSPAVEIRAGVNYQLTRAISMSVGWNGFWIDRIARGSTATVYEVPRMGVRTDNLEGVLVQGLTIGVQVNR